MQHTINEGNRLFKGTKFQDTWMINSDRLSAWWENEAQDYLRERNMHHRQVRAWGDTNSDNWRYKESVVGDRPELCGLDFHCFWDLDNALYNDILNTSSLPLGHKLRSGDGNQTELRESLLRAWNTHPLSHRIVEDILRYKVVIDRIVECKGGVVADHTAQHGGCSRHKRPETTAAATQASRVYQPTPEVRAVVQSRNIELRAKAKALCSE